MTRARRAPWWIYAVTIGGLNLARQVLFPPSQVGTAATISLFFAVLAISFAVVTALHALLAPRDRE
ncbi:hypothetical protein AB0M29_41405 [Streptomyces sp. NPDC051976]|uniref:hypothetical protein n=1 Tax=Streptomyces sp. NPDC051976 TaxID=3154947 RepID=UPI00341EFF47